MHRYALETVTFLVMAVTLVLAPVQARAQSGDSFRVTVPFSFNAGGGTLPAGTYTVSRTSQAGKAFFIQCVETKEAAAVIGSGGVQRDTDLSAVGLVFTAYGDEHYLSQVWMPWSPVGADTRGPDEDDRIANREPSRTVAVLAAKR